MKVALVGGGGFRMPLVEEAIAGTAGEVVDELVLHDRDERRLARIAEVLEGRRRERGGGPRVRTTTRPEDAIEGAGAVLVAVRPGGLAARIVDERVPLDVGVLGQETVGPGGIAFALRTVPVVVAIAEAVRERAPGAWFINFTNPAGIVTEAARSVLGERAIGICDSPAALWRHVVAAVDAPDAWRPAYVGLNHLGWLTGVRDGDGEMMPVPLDDPRIAEVHEVALAGLDDVRTSGAIPNEYLVYYSSTEEIAHTFGREGSRGAILAKQQARFYDRGPSSPADAVAAWRAAKDERHATYLAEARAAGGDDASPHAPADLSDDELGYGGVAAELLRAVAGGDGTHAILGVRNDGAVPWLDDDATVEVPCDVTSTGLAV
ncbi:MAG TPA: 6-phospho-beta-glucosidase, partial [Actinomycetota bacterium]|nr:6-phospho-beta-glucosidase [Actinomycetota bacterium]